MWGQVLGTNEFIPNDIFAHDGGVFWYDLRAYVTANIRENVMSRADWTFTGLARPTYYRVSGFTPRPNPFAKYKHSLVLNMSDWAGPISMLSLGRPI